MILIILAAGTAKPFGDFPKQLLDAGGETLLERQVRQFSPHCPKIYLATHRSELSHPSVEKINPQSRRWKCDTLNSILKPKSPIWPMLPREKILVIHGDVYFTDNAVSKIVLTIGEPISFFWNEGIEGTEAFGLCFLAQLDGFVKSALSVVLNEAETNGSPPHDCGLLRLMSACGSLGIKHERIGLTDGTRDFDNPDKHREWKKSMGL